MESINRIDVSTQDSETRMVLWIRCMDEFRMKDCPFDFKWIDNEIFFMYGGWGNNEPRSIGSASTLDDAKKLASEWLERYI